MLARGYGFPASRAFCVQPTTSKVVLCTPNAGRERDLFSSTAGLRPC